MKNSQAHLQQPPYDAIVTATAFSIGVRCADEDSLLAIEFIPQVSAQKGKNGLAREASRQLQAYLRDSHTRFDLPLKPAGTAFQQRVWAQIAHIAVGHTESYSTLAKKINNAPRAVGQACGANPWPIVVPCHRVISANGSLGGFNRQNGGFLLTVKRWLLNHEQPGKY